MHKQRKREREGEARGWNEGLIRELSPYEEWHLQMVGEPDDWVVDRAETSRHLRDLDTIIEWIGKPVEAWPSHALDANLRLTDLLSESSIEDLRGINQAFVNAWLK